MANYSCAIVEAVALEVPPCAHSNFVRPCRPIAWEDRCKIVFPRFSGGEFELDELCCILDNVSIPILTLPFLTSFAVFTSSFVFAVGWLFAFQ